MSAPYRSAPSIFRTSTEITTSGSSEPWLLKDGCALNGNDGLSRRPAAIGMNRHPGTGEANCVRTSPESRYLPGEPKGDLALLGGRRSEVGIRYEIADDVALVINLPPAANGGGRHGVVRTIITDNLVNPATRPSPGLRHERRRQVALFRHGLLLRLFSRTAADPLVASSASSSSDLRSPTYRQRPRGTAPGSSRRSSRGKAKVSRSSAASTSSTSPKPRSASQASTSVTRISGTDAPLDSPTVRTPSSHRSSTAALSSTRRAAGAPASSATSTMRTELDELAEPTTRNRSTRGA